MKVDDLETRLQSELEKLNDADHFHALRAHLTEYAAKSVDRRYSLRFVGFSDGPDSRVTLLARVGIMRAASNPQHVRPGFGLDNREFLNGPPCANCHGYGFVMGKARGETD